VLYKKQNPENTHRTLGIVKENLCRISDAMILLSLGSSTIDAGRSFGGIATHEAEG
jgi:hypothetical protein